MSTNEHPSRPDPGETLDSSWTSSSPRSAVDATLGTGVVPSALARSTVAGSQGGASAPTLDGRGAARVPLSDAPREPSFSRGLTAGAGRDFDRGASIGRYLVLSLLGRGAMGEVYAAYDPELDRRVALKLLHTAGGGAEARNRLIREARALAKLSHPNVVQVHDVGEHEGDVFVAMELVDGEPLDAWCNGTPRPSWQDVLAAYLEVARGLDAAHRQGLVHRDVKPRNILRGRDGRTRLLDFGLATEGESAVDESGGSTLAGVERDAASPVGDGTRLVRLTSTGALLGTPLYMAPEQYDSPRVLPAADQYALCVALHEGLYGAPPFPVDRRAILITLLSDLRTRKLEGPPAAPPAGSPVPAWVYRAIRRGLSPKPEDRFRSLAELIAALSEDPDARPRVRRRGAVVSILGAAILGLAVAAGAKAGALRDPCAHPDRELAGVWDEGVAGRVRVAFAATGRPGAEGAAARVAGVLDRYAAQWSEMRGQVCSAGQGREPAAAGRLLGLRERCLERRRGQLQALTAMLAEAPDAALVDRAVSAAAALYPVASCADVEALSARVPPPEDPALAARVAALVPRADRLATLFQAGRYSEGVALGESLLGEVSAVPYAPLRAEVELWLGRLRAEGTGEYEKGEALLRRAMVSAAEGRDDVLEAAAWGGLLFVVAELEHRFDEAAAIRALGQAAIARARDARAEADFRIAEGAFLMRTAHHAEARTAQERALALREQALGPDHPDVAAALGALGNTLLVAGDYEASIPFTSRALALRERVLGPDHPDVAKSLNNLASAYLGLGDYPRARATHERTLALRERLLGPDHPEVASSLNNLGNVLYATGAYPAARAAHERALSVREKALGPDHPYVAQSLVNLGDVLLHQGDAEGVLSRCERALGIMRKALGPDHPDLADPLADLGRAQVSLGDLDTARTSLERAVAVREKARGPTCSDLSDALLGLGELHLARHAPREALPFLERAAALQPSEGPSPEVQLTLAEALWEDRPGDPRARVLAREARARYERLGHAHGLARADAWLAGHSERVTAGPFAPPR